MEGRQLGQYHLKKPLGKGGMGEVWLAWDERLDREVAVKILPEESAADLKRRKRFLREAKLASSLSHPGIVAIFDVNEANDLCYMAMELVRGETLLDRLRRARCNATEARSIIQQVAEALAVAHSSGVTHRDLKPSNIMIGPTGKIKILDLGLAQLDEPTTGEETQTQLTAAGAVLGTYGYMAPEQLLGDKADFRSDIFSLGVVWFEMLSGQSPFRGDSRSEQMRRMLSEGARNIKDIIRDIPDTDAAILEKCLESKPDNRYSSASELLHALAPPPSTVARTWRIAAILALVVAAGLGAAGFYWTRPPSLPIAAIPAGDLATARAALERYDIPGRIETAISEAEAALKKDPSSAPAYQLLAQAKVFEHYVKRDSLIARQAEGWARKALELDQFMGSAHSLLAWALSLAGRLDEAEKPLRQGLDLNPRSHVSHLAMAHWLGRKRLNEQATKEYDLAAQLSPQSWYPLAMAGSFLYGIGDYDKALIAFEKALRLTPDNVRLLNSISSTYHQLDRDDEAISALQRAIEIRPSPTMYTNLGTLLFFAGRYAQALPAMQKAVELSAGDATKWGNLGDTLRWVPGRRAESIVPYRTAISILQEKLAKDTQDPFLLASTAIYSAKAGSPKDASTMLSRLMSLKDIPPQALYEAAVTYELLGQRKPALDTLGKALKAGYSRQEIRNDPELSSLRQDPAFRTMMSAAN